MHQFQFEIIKEKKDKSKLEKFQNKTLENKLWTPIIIPKWPIERNYMKINPTLYDIKEIKKEILNLNETWINKDLITNNWESLTLKSQNGEEQSFLKKTDFTNYIYTDIIEKLPSIKELLEKIPTDIYLVRLLKLKKDGKIKFHTDEEVFKENNKIIRVHLPIITHKDVKFQIGYPLQKPAEGFSVWNAEVLYETHLEEGYFWYTNVNTLHSVTNNSPIDRIHLVCDMKPFFKI